MRKIRRLKKRDNPAIIPAIPLNIFYDINPHIGNNDSLSAKRMIPFFFLLNSNLE